MDWTCLATEVVYRGEVHAGEQTPIIDKELFEAVQAKLAERAVTRNCVARARPPSYPAFCSTIAVTA